ncbi:MAG: small multi-drug export protein [Clostridia bacterium]|nr:small multi-drug export protein [Clostridia bacterium]
MQEFFVTFEKELYVFLLSLIPVVELRGAIPVGIGMGLDVMTTFIVAVIGNIIPVPFILLLTRPVMSWLKKTKALKPFAEWIEGKIEKNREKIMRYSAFGLFLFVAIPIPGTGAWSGAIAASALDMRMKYALPSIVAGVVTAGVIMCFGTSLVKWVINIF